MIWIISEFSNELHHWKRKRPSTVKQCNAWIIRTMSNEHNAPNKVNLENDVIQNSHCMEMICSGAPLINISGNYNDEKSTDFRDENREFHFGVLSRDSIRECFREAFVKTRKMSNCQVGGLWPYGKRLLSWIRTWFLLPYVLEAFLFHQTHF